MTTQPELGNLKCEQTVCRKATEEPCAQKQQETWVLRRKGGNKRSEKERACDVHSESYRQARHRYRFSEQISGERSHRSANADERKVDERKVDERKVAER